MCLVSNIPLEKTDKIQPFLIKHCKNGGTLSQAKYLRDYYVPSVAEDSEEKISSFIKENSRENVFITINIDESSDEKERTVANAILSFHG